MVRPSGGGDNLDTFLSRLDSPKQVGKEWVACCPAHDDASPSLNVRRESGGKLLVICRSSGCSVENICKAVKLPLSILFSPDSSNGDGLIVAEYDYRDASGNLSYQVVKLYTPPGVPKKFRQRRPNGHGGWVWKVSGFVPYTLYRLPKLLAAAIEEPVFITEGEKDCDNVARLGLIATTNPTGAGKWSVLDPAIVRAAIGGHRVVLLPDNDRPGEDHARDVAARLQGIAAEVRVLRLPGLPPKGDVSDWLAHGGTKEQLLELMKVAPLAAEAWTVPGDAGPTGATSTGEPAGGAAGGTQTPTPGPLPLLFYGDMEPVLDAADFVEGLLADETMSVLYGESGCGKTFFALDVSLHVAAGMTWRDREVERRGVLYLALEGGHGIKNRVAAFRKKFGLADLPFAIVPVQVNLLNSAADIARVIEAAKRAAATLDVQVGLIVVDTLSRALFGGNENSPEDMGALVVNLDYIRQVLRAHVMAVHHSGKDAARGARGHSLLRAATDTEIEVVRDRAGGLSVARVTKQKDLPGEGDEFAFKLESVQLGINRRGKPVTSCVVVPVETVRPAGSS